MAAGARAGAETTARGSASAGLVMMVIGNPLLFGRNVRDGDAHPEQSITFLDRTVCYCSTMNRIDLPHLVWALESLADGQVVNVIEVDPDTEHWAKVALQRMLDLPGKSHRD